MDVGAHRNVDGLRETWRSEADTDSVTLNLYIQVLCTLYLIVRGSHLCSSAGSIPRIGQDHNVKVSLFILFDQVSFGTNPYALGCVNLTSLSPSNAGVPAGR
jgi:hypothetical protein